MHNDAVTVVLASISFRGMQFSLYAATSAREFLGNNGLDYPVHPEPNMAYGRFLDRKINQKIK